jgi:predicted KAP-like P-loop ATPase
MWSDTDTDRDFLNFSGIAETVAEIIIQARGQPISIGVSGAWGTGKSSLLRLIHQSLKTRPGSESHSFLFVEFNAWLYQGYDDARAALIDVIAKLLEQEAEKKKTGLDKARALLKRVNWLRTVKFAGSLAGAAYGLPPIGAAAELIPAVKGALSSSDDQPGFAALAENAGGLLKPKAPVSPPSEIHALRENIESLLGELKATLVVLVDDLDRCLPHTTISTLEAIRLFLFLKNTAFVVAADDVMVKHAVRHHFRGIDDEVLITNYFDKLIQVPIRVPPLGIQEVRAYMILLFVEASGFDDATKERIRSGICLQLRQTWQGKRVDRAFVATLAEFPPDLIGKFDAADRLALLMASPSGIGGNPRLIKRFLNALSVRMAIAKSHGVGVDEAVLAKLLLFERLGTPGAYDSLLASVSANTDGKAAFLGPLEDAAIAGETAQAPWDTAFMRDWLALPPRLADLDLRGALYVSREHAPLISASDRLSAASADVLSAFLESPGLAGSLSDALKGLPRADLAIIMDRLLERARREQTWGVPPILDACLVVSRVDKTLASRLAGFLTERPPAQIQPNIIPKLADEPWARDLFARWDAAGVSKPVKAAMTLRK